MGGGLTSVWPAPHAIGDALAPMQSTEYLVVLEVMARVHGRERERMYRALRDRTRAEVDEAITSLEQAGVVTVKGARVHASSALTRLNDLGLIGI